MDGDFEPRPYLVTRVSESSEGGVVYQARRIPPGSDADDPPGSQRVSAYTPEEAILAARQTVRPMERHLFTPEEMQSAITAVAKAENKKGHTIMGHIRSDRDVAPESAEAIRKIVVAAYVEMLVGD